MNALHNMYIYHDVNAVASICRDARIEQFNSQSVSYKYYDNFNSVITILHIRESRTT